jgi:hypothetical protein
MKNDVMPSIVQMERKVLEKLVTEVKETLATDTQLSSKNGNSFGLVDLWNIQKNMKSANRPFKRRRNQISNYIYP